MAIRLGTVFAHPDDETLGAGGTLIRAARRGAEVHSLCLTKGEAGWTGDPLTKGEAGWTGDPAAPIAYIRHFPPQDGSLEGDLF